MNVRVADTKVNERKISFKNILNLLKGTNN